MKTITLMAGLALALILPATAVAKPSVDREDRRQAKAECKLLRGKTAATRAAFLTEYRNFGACVRATAAEEARQEQTAHNNASKECKAERAQDPDAFAEEYGTGPKMRNAFGKCVSQHARENERKADREDRQDAVAFKHAAKECAAEREMLGADVFAEEYGRNANDRNAFGKCVSKKARENEAEQPTG
jgi:cobalamin biosynthesis protein CobT